MADLLVVMDGVKGIVWDFGRLAEGQTVDGASFALSGGCMGTFVLRICFIPFLLPIIWRI